MAERIKRRGDDIKGHWASFTRMLGRKLAPGVSHEPQGYSYYLRGAVDAARVEDAFVTGDAAGLATRDMCEGIGPAVRSGMRAAQAILGQTEYSLAGLTGASLGGGLASRALDWAFTRGAGRAAPTHGASLGSVPGP
jgi:flavin-dependent dehydrogenase